MEKENITKDDFEAYEAVRESGVTNMFAISMVSDLSCLKKDTITSIMKNYDFLSEKFSGVRK